MSGTSGTASQPPQTDTSVIMLCDTTEAAVSTPFLRQLKYTGGVLVSSSDTRLDGTTPYAVAGAVGVCAADSAGRYVVEQEVLCDQALTGGEVTASISFLRRYIIDTRTGQQIGLPQDLQLNGFTPYTVSGSVVADCSAAAPAPPSDPCSAVTPGAMEPVWEANHAPNPSAPTVNRTVPFLLTFPQPVSVTATVATVNGAAATLALVSGTTYSVTAATPVAPCTAVSASVQPVTVGGCPEGAYTSPSETTHPLEPAYAWGWNPSGRLGDGTATQRQTPVAQATPDSTHFTAIDGGTLGSSLAIDDHGAVWGWGVGVYGQLGTGQTTDALSPVAALMPNGATATAIAAAANSSAFLDTTGRVFTCGAGGLGQLGTGGTANRSTWSAVSFPDEATITSIAAGYDHMIALSDEGAVYGWGYDGYGNASGTPAVVNVLSPVLVPFPDGTVITSIAAGSYFNVAVDSLGRVWTWGIDNWQQLGDNDADVTTTPTPTLITLPAGVSAATVYAGFYNASFVSTEGDAYVWGSNVWGSIGQGSTVPATANTPTLVPLHAPVADMAWGTDSAIALLSTGEVYTWGYGGSGQMGNGSVAAVNATPLLVTALPQGGIPTSVAACDYAMFVTVDQSC